jgi:hypothetical protein
MADTTTTAVATYTQPHGMTEYLDVLDSKGVHTGERKLRAHVHRDGDWHRTVHVWVLNSARSTCISFSQSAAV